MHCTQLHQLLLPFSGKWLITNPLILKYNSHHSANRQHNIEFPGFWCFHFIPTHFNSWVPWWIHVSSLVTMHFIKSWSWMAYCWRNDRACHSLCLVILGNDSRDLSCTHIMKSQLHNHTEVVPLTGSNHVSFCYYSPVCSLILHFLHACTAIPAVVGLSLLAMSLTVTHLIWNSAHHFSS